MSLEFLQNRGFANQVCEGRQWAGPGRWFETISSGRHDLGLLNRFNQSGLYWALLGGEGVLVGALESPKPRQEFIHQPPNGVTAFAPCRNSTFKVCANFSHCLSLTSRMLSHLQLTNLVQNNAS